MLKMCLQYMPWLVLMLVQEGNFYSVTSLPCKVHAELGLQYRKVSWYKVDEDSFTGLVLRNLQTNETLLYKSAQKLYQVGKDYSLIFSNSSLSDCGRYHCRLWPPIGHQIKEGDYDFYPRGCPQPIKMQKSDVLQSKEQSSNQRDSTVSVIVGLVTPGGLLIIVLAVIAVTIKNSKLKQEAPYKSLHI